MSDPFISAASLEGIPSTYAGTRDGIDGILRDRGLRRSTPDDTARALLLGAAAMGDIGKLFPDSDPAYEGADSLALLKIVAGRVREAGLEIENVDATVLAQAPKLAPHILQMRGNIAAALCVDPGQVSVKATTEEGLGFTGTREGIAAHAVVLIERIS